MANIQPPQHPNIRATAEALRVLANQAQAFVDNPGALDGALLLQEIRNLRVEMNRRFDQIEQRASAEYVSSIHFTLGHFGSQYSRINMNAKLENRFLRDNDRLAPLRSYRNNTEIAGFPATPDEITRLACTCSLSL